MAQTVGVVGLVTMGTGSCHFGLGSTVVQVEGTRLVALDVILDLLLDLLVEKVGDALILQDLHLL